MRGPGRAALHALAIAALAALAGALPSPATAHPESAASTFSPLVVAAGHTPEPVAPGAQWEGWLQLAPAHGVERATYQVCNVADGVCFAPPANATLDRDRLRFDTTDYVDASTRQPVEWQAGWRVGVKWALHHAGGNVTLVPHGAGPTDPIEDHYLAFDIPAAPEEGSPAPGQLLAVTALLGAAWVLRKAKT